MRVGARVTIVSVTGLQKVGTPTGGAKRRRRKNDGTYHCRRKDVTCVILREAKDLGRCPGVMSFMALLLGTTYRARGHGRCCLQCPPCVTSRSISSIASSFSSRTV